MFATIKNAIESYSSHLKHSLYKISVLERRQVNERMLDADYENTLGYALREAKIKEIKRGLLSLAKESPGEAIQKSTNGVSETAKQTIANINAGFDEAQIKIDEMRQLADFVAGKTPKDMANQHYGVVHDSEYVFEKTLDRHRCIVTPLDNQSVNSSIRITINNDGTTKTERYIDDTPRQEYDYCAFYLGDDRYAHFGKWGWLAVADLTEYDDDYRNAVNELNAGDFDASQAADIIREGIKKGDLLIAKSHNPIEAMRLLCEKLDNKDG